MISLLKISEELAFECQKNIANYDNTILWISDDYIPAWMYETDLTIVSYLLNELDIDKLVRNNEIDDISSISLSTSLCLNANGYLYSDKLAQSLDSDKLYYLRMKTASKNYYSEIFKKIQ